MQPATLLQSEIPTQNGTPTKDGNSKNHKNGNKTHHEDIDNMSEGFNIWNFLETEEMSQEEIDRCEFWVTANRITRESGVPNFAKAKIQVNTSWNFEKLEEWLQFYEDKELINYLKYSWPLNAINTIEDHSLPSNQKGARENPEDIRAFLRKELEEGAIIGPFKKNPFGKVARFSPLDTRPKKDSTEKQVILNLSYPFKGNSVNSSINTTEYSQKEEMKVKYPSVDNLANIVR